MTTVCFSSFYVWWCDYEIICHDCERITYIFMLQANQLTDVPYRNVKELEDYAEQSVSSVNYLLLQCFGRVWIDA